jgi:photosystem I subunit III
MRRLFIPILFLAIYLTMVAPTFAANQTLVPCRESPAFLDRMQNAPAGYYYTKPFEAYSSELLCGDDGLPHLPLDRLDRAVDVFIPIALFLYVAGFIGWSGRAYLQAANQAKNPEEMEIFINLPLAITSIFQGLLWPLLALQELVSGTLTARDRDLSVSPR